MEYFIWFIKWDNVKLKLKQVIEFCGSFMVLLFSFSALSLFFSFRVCVFA